VSEGAEGERSRGKGGEVGELWTEGCEMERLYARSESSSGVTDSFEDPSGSVPSSVSVGVSSCVASVGLIGEDVFVGIVSGVGGESAED
jgi:hypothetical protein